jgi:acyl-CoA synthetase (NDP forming)
VSGNDVLQYWEDDDRTDVVLLYLESFGNPRKFTRIARRLTRRKPIVAVKSGEADADAAGAHPVSALLDQSGVIRVDTPSELFDVARVLAVQPVPRGRRVAVVSNSRGAGVLSVDAVRGAGLAPAWLAADTLARLPRARIAGAPDAPVDLSFAAGAAEYEAALDAVLADPGVDAVLVVYAPPGATEPEEVGRAIVRAVERCSSPRTRAGDDDALGRCGVPVVAVFLGAETGAPLGDGPVRIPLFEFPNGAAEVLGATARYGAYLAQPAGVLPDLDPDELEPARALVEAMLAERGEPMWLGTAAAAELLQAVGLPMIPFRLVGSADEAVAAADAIGHPVVVKATGLARLAPSEAGGVALDVHGADEVRAAFERMAGALGDAMHPAMVQRMAPAGLDVVVAGHQDLAQGAVISVGFGGTVADANPRRAVRVAPITDADARRVVADSPLAGLVPRLTVDDPPTPLESLIMRLGWIVEQIPELDAVELNPVMAAGEAVSITAAKIRLAPPLGVPDPEVRRL